MLKARLIHRSRAAYRGGIIEMVLWHLPQPVPSSRHPYKYRLAYIVEGRRVVGYDNERGKGDHKHWKNQEFSYDFRNPDRLVRDFLVDVDAYHDE